MKTIKLVLLVVLVGALLAGCGKGTSENDPTPTPAATATPTQQAQKDETPTPTPTEEPQRLEGTVFERMYSALHNTFAEKNCTVDSAITGMSSSDETSQTKQIRFVEEENGEMLFVADTFDDGSKQNKYVFLSDKGGVDMATWWGDGKMNYDYMKVSEEDASFMYSIIHGLREPGDAAFQNLVRLFASVFPDWPTNLISDQSSLLGLLAPFSSEEYLQKTFSYHRLEDGTDVFIIKSQTIVNFLQYTDKDFRSFRYYVGEQTFNMLPMLGDIEFAVSYNGVYLDKITLRCIVADKAAEWKITFSNIGTTTYNLPTSAQEKFEAIKNGSMAGDGVTDEVSWLREYQQDALAGRVDQDVAMLREIANAYREIVKDPEIVEAVKKAIGAQDAWRIIYEEDSRYDVCDIPEIDQKLKERFGDAKIKSASVWLRPAYVVIYLVPENGGISVYFD